VIITAGANQKPGETRLDLLAKNRAVFGSIVPQAVKYAPDALYLVVTNPVDALTLETIRLSGLPAGRVIGTGTVLDTSRLRYLLSRHTGVDPRNIHAFVLGEHGDSEFVAWSRASIAGMTLDEYCADCGRCKGPISAILDTDIENQVRRAAYSIIELKGATYYAIAVAVRRIVEAILRDEQSILTVSTLLEGQYGLSGVCLSVPAIVGRKGVERVLEVGLKEDERERLAASARAVKKAMGE
ncbi:MAG: L-lactate dehydrogenase, partial [Clostridia bacterium]|nr:L-lactate dehydrogenase [Clostridia bacterium]